MYFRLFSPSFFSFLLPSFLRVYCVCFLSDSIVFFLRLCFLSLKAFFLALSASVSRSASVVLSSAPDASSLLSLYFCLFSFSLRIIEINSETEDKCLFSCRLFLFLKNRFYRPSFSRLLSSVHFAKAFLSISKLSNNFSFLFVLLSAKCPSP